MPRHHEHRRERAEQITHFQRSRLLRSALTVAYERGYERMTVAAIIADARISRRTFYEIFENCDDCYLAVFDEVLAGIAAAVRPAYDGDGRWPERLRRGLAALLAFLEFEREMGALAVSHLRGAGPRCPKRRTRALATLGRVVESGRLEAVRGHEPPSLAAEVVVGGALAVIDARLQLRRRRMMGLLNPLMSMIVLPYLGPAAAADELKRTSPSHARRAPLVPGDPVRQLGIRVTYRTARTLAGIAESPGASNVEVGQRAGISDQGQTSKLLSRLCRLGLIENTGAGSPRGTMNAWQLTPDGVECERAISRATGATTCGRETPARGSAC